LAVEYLNLNAFSEYSYLKINCAKALKAFGDETVLNKCREIIFNSTDDFEKNSAFEFIYAYNDENSIKETIKPAIESVFCENIISNLLDNVEFNSLKTILNQEDMLKIFSILLEGYPEDISLDTIQYYQICDFIEFLKVSKTQFAENLLAIAKMKFSEFLENDAYLFDLNENIKNELKLIVEKLNGLNLNFENIKDELHSCEKIRLNVAIDVIREYKLNSYCEDLAQLVNERKVCDEILAKCAETLKVLKKIDLIDVNLIKNLDNENLRALIETYL